MYHKKLFHDHYYYIPRCVFGYTARHKPAQFFLRQHELAMISEVITRPRKLYFANISNTLDGAKQSTFFTSRRLTACIISNFILNNAKSYIWIYACIILTQCKVLVEY